jgi:hypothetical protein
MSLRTNRSSEANFAPVYACRGSIGVIRPQLQSTDAESAKLIREAH